MMRDQLDGLDLRRSDERASRQDGCGKGATQHQEHAAKHRGEADAMVPEQWLGQDASLEHQEGENDCNLCYRAKLSRTQARLSSDAIRWDLQAILSTGNHP